MDESYFFRAKHNRSIKIQKPDMKKGLKEAPK